MTDLQFPRAAPSVADMLNRVKYDVSREINCHLICKIESIDAATNTITCSSAFKRRLSDDTELDYPLFVDVPLFILSGGDSFLFIPPKVGDWCLLCFNDRDLDNWWYAGEVRTPASPRAHSLSDGMALVGFRPQSNPLTLALDAVTLKVIDLPINIENHECSIAINAGITLDGKAKKLKIKNSSKGIKELLEGVIDLMEKIITAGNANSLSGGPVSWTDPLPTEFIDLKTDVSALFEE